LNAPWSSPWLAKRASSEDHGRFDFKDTDTDTDTDGFDARAHLRENRADG
jgi:hypothetical protein